MRERVAAGTPDLTAFRSAVEVLAAADPADLERHLLGTLDAAAYRVDAWVTSLASRRLAELRSDEERGALVGGYGWAERLAPSTADVVAETPPGEPGELLSAVDDPGFLHAPSLHQAQVAALLRNAHLANGGGADDPFAISLTSERVRLARTVFDGVRAGRTVGAVLGYLVERDLHEHGLDKAVDNAREVSPLPGEEHLPPAARRLDGLSLHRLWAASEDHAVDHLVGGDPSEADRTAAQAVLRRLGCHGGRHRRRAPGRAGAPVRAGRPGPRGEHRDRLRPWARAAVDAGRRADPAVRGRGHAPGRESSWTPTRRRRRVGRTGAARHARGRAGARRMAGPDARRGHRTDRHGARRRRRRSCARCRCRTWAWRPRDLVRMAGAGEHGWTGAGGQGGPGVRRRPAAPGARPGPGAPGPARGGSLAVRAAGSGPADGRWDAAAAARGRRARGRRRRSSRRGRPPR